MRHVEPPEEEDTVEEQGLTAHGVAGLLADPHRASALAAVVLGSRTTADVASVAGLSRKDASAALHRMLSAGLVVDGDEGLEVAYGALRQAALTGRAAAAPDPSGLAPFVQGRRLLSLPAQASRRAAVLAHVAAQTFAVGGEYDEPAVNALLEPWCAGGEVDRAALRRYLVEDGLLSRGSGVYRAGPGAVPGHGEQAVAALGLR